MKWPSGKCEFVVKRGHKDSKPLKIFSRSQVPRNLFVDRVGACFQIFDSGNLKAQIQAESRMMNALTCLVEVGSI